ncbi:right-handed parallel beta-helix repeat-containing protein, partial [Jatrophihabitans endophyticus]|uniref:right-handed parallel beta-helix repeat-containing protein n=1 Tax=Jatrophihabitans endophyticus TaxID=1206085 RepID=UPI0019EDD6A4
NNNTEHFNYAPVSGGVKITRSRNLTVTDSVFENNNGPGLWFDESCYNTTLTGDSFLSNGGNGLSYEISSTGTFANNVATDNGAIGFKINDSDNVKMWNNTLGGNGRNIEIVEDTRRGANLSLPGHNPHRAQPDPTEPWIIQNDTVANNLLLPGGANSLEVYANDTTGEYTAAGLGTVIDGNVFTGQGAPVIAWGLANKALAQYRTAADFLSATGTGSHNVDASSASAAQALSGTGVPIPQNVADLIGVAAGDHQVGALSS